MSSSPIQFVDRRSGEVRTEVVLGESFVKLVYEQPIGRLLRRAVLTHPAFSKLYGAYQDSSLSRGAIDKTISTLSIDMNDYEVPAGGFVSFNDFFTRRLKPGARPITNDASRMASPADARVFAYQGVKSSAVYPVKGHPLLLSELLKSAVEGERYEGGSVVVLRLCPSDYHRFHFPCDGEATVARTIAGPLESVNPWALTKGKPILDTNLRDLTYIDSPLFGRVAYVEVGAMCVGSIVHTYKPGHVGKGDEKGFFQFGGSTVILALESHVKLDADLVENTNRGLETYVRMGDAIATATRLTSVNNGAVS
ncbi:MAG: phosphatidylserine decarboxylase [Polyangiaceae bacterium]